MKREDTSTTKQLSHQQQSNSHINTKATHINTKATHINNKATLTSTTHINNSSNMFSTQSTSASTQNTVNSTSQGLVIRPKGRGRNTRRELYGHESAKYMNDFRPAHERSNTLLSVLGTATIDNTFQNASTPHPSFNKDKHQQIGNKQRQAFPPLGENSIKIKTNTWVTELSDSNEHMKQNDDYMLAPVPESKKVINKMQVLNKSTTNDAVDNLNFKELEKELLAEISRWKRIAEERAVILDEFETTIRDLNRELDDLYNK